jgi:hypothetical protein
MFQTPQEAINTLNIPKTWKRGHMHSKLKKASMCIENKKKYGFYDVVSTICKDFTPKEPKLAYNKDGDILLFVDDYNTPPEILNGVVQKFHKNGIQADYFIAKYPKRAYTNMYREKDTKILHFGYKGFYRGNIIGLKFKI